MENYRLSAIINMQGEDNKSVAVSKLECFRAFFTHILDGDVHSILNHFVYFILFSLALPSLSPSCIKQAVSLFDMLSKNINARAVLVQLSSIRSLIVNHRDTHLVALSLPEYMRYRTVFYHALTQIMLHVAVPGDLEGFVKPFINEIQELKQKQQFDAMIPLLRDVTGVFGACTEERDFVCCYDLLCVWSGALSIGVRFASRSSNSRWIANGETPIFPPQCFAFSRRSR